MLFIVPPHFTTLLQRKTSILSRFRKPDIYSALKTEQKIIVKNFSENNTE
jgi:hypothetical protein